MPDSEISMHNTKKNWVFSVHNTKLSRIGVKRCETLIAFFGEKKNTKKITTFKSVRNYAKKIIVMNVCSSSDTCAE